MSRNELGIVRIARQIGIFKAEDGGSGLLFGLQVSTLPDGRFRATLYDLAQNYGKGNGYMCFVPLQKSKDGKTAAPMTLKGQILSECRLGGVMQKAASILETEIERISWRARAGKMAFRINLEPVPGGRYDIITEIASARSDQSTEFLVEFLEPLSWHNFNRQFKDNQTLAANANLLARRSRL